MKEMNTPTCQNTCVVETSRAAVASSGASWETTVMETGKSAPDARPAIIRPTSSVVKISGKDADDRADSVDQINPVEEQHAANLVCEAAAEQGAEGNGESQDAGKQSNLRGVKTQASCHTVMVDDSRR